MPELEDIELEDIELEDTWAEWAAIAADLPSLQGIAGQLCANAIAPDSNLLKDSIVGGSQIFMVDKMCLVEGNWVRKITRVLKTGSLAKK